MREDVLKIEFERIFDKWACRIIYQNTNILERGKFKDENIGVFSIDNFDYNHYLDELYILSNINEDDRIILINDKEKEIIEDKVKLINEKYGTEKRWRAEKGDIYYFIQGNNFFIDDDYDIRDNMDNKRYELGNYFKTEDLAVKKLIEIKELLLK